MLKLKRTRLFGLIQGINVALLLSGAKFAYALVKNKKKIQSELDILKEVAKLTEEPEEFRKKRIELCEQHCEKDDKKKAIIKNNSYCGLNDNKEFNKEIENLKIEYKTALEEQKKAIEEHNKLLQEEVEIDLYKVLLKDVPEGITGKQLEAIQEIVEEK